jgi:hypothetical protein
MLRSDEPYAVIALDERDFGPHRRHELSISLTLAFLLSARLRFHFPMSDDVSREVDRAFDQVLKGLPMESKGIAYRKDLRCYGKICLLEGAKLVVTSDPQIQKRMDAVSSPNIFLDFKSGRPPFIKWRFLENLEDDILKQQIIVYSKLINTARDAAQPLGLLDRLGAIGQGKIVDLILLEANPSENVENTKRIAAAVVGGKLLPKESLKGMLAEAEATIADRERQR